MKEREGTDGRGSIHKNIVVLQESIGQVKDEGYSHGSKGRI